MFGGLWIGHKRIHKTLIGAAVLATSVTFEASTMPARAEFTQHKIARIISILRIKYAQPQGSLRATFYSRGGFQFVVTYGIIPETNQKLFTIQGETVFSSVVEASEREFLRAFDYDMEVKERLPYVYVDIDADGVLDDLYDVAFADAPSHPDSDIDTKRDQAKYTDLVDQILETVEKDLVPS